ncbi:MAG: cyclic pyranopterin monophosphate synthase MoaC [Candidatus Riflebacteria bacterium]|nr:cyclic pyranopterin monophosphate synthase MoaC [Candidatus Riflebacteria bacterium]
MTSNANNDFTHIDSAGRAKMVDVSSKIATFRRAVAYGVIKTGKNAYSKLVENSLAKGDAFAVSRIAGIMAAKKTSELIPLTHPLGLNSVHVHFAPIADDRIAVFSDVRTDDRTGVEMEAMTSVSVAMLNLYDMVKAVEKGAEIITTKLLFKDGGKSGRYTAEGVEIGKIEKLAISPGKGTPKEPIDKCQLITEFGLKDDAHAGKWHRQVSLLAIESVEKMRSKGLDVTFGSFAENICTSGLTLYELPIGSLMLVGEGTIMQITQIGKECHTKCAVYHRAGDCVMPREGIFTRVLTGGEVSTGDQIIVIRT